MTREPISRRGLLRGGTAAGLAALGGSWLAGCGNQGGSAVDSGSSPGVTKLVFLEPGDPPAGWEQVLGAVNTKLAADRGLEIEIQWIGWSSYKETELLKFTSGEKFTGALEADWLHHAQLANDGAIYSLDDYLTEAAYPKLMSTIDPITFETSKIDGKLFGIPMVNAAGFVLGFMTRGDLGGGDVTDFASFEKFLYDVKQNESSMVPYGLDDGYVNNTQVLLDETYWQEGKPEYLQVRLDDNYPLLYISAADAIAGNARLVPVWEVDHVMQAFERVRRYYLDGILNQDALSVDRKTVYSLFGQGKFAAAIGVTDGLMTSTYGATRDNVAGAELELVMPFSVGESARPWSEFGSSNHMAFNIRGEQVEAGLTFLEWLSEQENHDLLQYGIEGQDWTLHDDGSYESTSEYVFPGYTMSWRVPLERNPVDMIESERRWFAFAQQFDSFEEHPLADFSLDASAIEPQIAQFGALVSEVIRPLQAGTVDVTPGMDAIKTQYTNAGLDEVVAETERQLGEYFGSRS